MDPTNQGYTGNTGGDFGNAIFCAFLFLVIGAILWVLFLIFALMVDFIIHGLVFLGIVGLILYLVVVPHLLGRWYQWRWRRKRDQANQTHPSL
jgi:membrane protein YdbS with pleckstrin-like domain